MSNISTIPSSNVNESLGKSWRAVIANVWLMIGFTFFYYLLTLMLGKIPGISMVTSLFSFIYTVSMFSAFYHIEKNGTMNFNDFFHWSPKFMKLFLANLIVFIATVIVFIPVIVIMILFFGTGWFSAFYGNTHYFSEHMSDLSGGVVTSIVILGFVAAILLLLFSFALQFIVLFKDLSLSESMRLSWKVGRNNMGQLFLFMLLAIGVMLLGVLALVVGVLVAVPVVIGMQYFFLRSIFPESEAGEWDFLKQETP